MLGVRITLSWATWLALIAYVNAFGSGAPDGACDSLMPSHNASPRNDRPIYRITTSKATIGPGDQLEVTLSGETTFKGFFLRARQAGQFLGGTFQANSFGSTRCNDQGITHSNPAPKNNVKIVWTAPPDLSPADVQFVATFVQEKEIFWTEVVSSDVRVIDGAGNNGSNLGGNGRIQTISGPGASGQGDPVNLRPINNGGFGIQSPGTVSADPDCGTSKGCYHDCQDGSPCTYAISWTFGQEDVQFQFMFKTSSKSDQWIALGLSHDAAMGDDSVMECVMENGKVLVKTSYNKDKFNDYPDNKLAGLSDYGGSVKDGVLACNFRRKIDYSVEPRVFSLRQPYYIMVATGEAVSGNKFPHSYENLPKVSAQKISFQNIDSVGQGLDPSYPLVKSHGTIMIFAWMLFATWGLFTARHGKSMFHDSKPFGIHVWFHLHRFCMIITAFLTTVGLILVLIESKGYSYIPDVPGKGYRFIHPPLGLILVIITLVNPLMAIFRPDQKSPSRKVFNWSHWGIGLSAWFISLALILIGLDVSKSQADVEAIYVVFAFIVYQLLAEILIRLVPFMVAGLGGSLNKGLSKTKNSYDFSMSEPPSTETPNSPENDATSDKNEDDNEGILRHTNTITSIIIVFHLVASVCFVIAVLYFFLHRL